MKKAEMLLNIAAIALLLLLAALSFVGARPALAWGCLAAALLNTAALILRLRR